MAERGGRREGSGRKVGSPNRATAEVRDLALDYGPAAVAELARLFREAKNETARIAACNSIIERAYGRALAGRMIRLTLPDTSTVEGVTKAVAAVVQSTSHGEITPGEAGDICAILDTQRRTIELSDVEARLAKLEAAQVIPQ